MGVIKLDVKYKGKLYSKMELALLLRREKTDIKVGTLVNRMNELLKDNPKLDLSDFEDKLITPLHSKRFIYMAKYKYNDELYTLTGLCKKINEKFNICAKTIREKLKDGLELDEIIENHSVKKYKKFNDKLYTQTELSKVISELYDIPLYTVKYRIFRYFKKHNELNDNDAKKLFAPLYFNDNHKIYDYMGGKYTLRQLSEKTKLPRKIIYTRLYNGWTIEKACEQSPKKHILYEYKGKSYTRKELVLFISDKTGVAINTLYQRVYDLHKINKKISDSDIDKFLFAPKDCGILRNKPKYKYKNKLYSQTELAEIALKYINIPLNTMRLRVFNYFKTHDELIDKDIKNILSKPIKNNGIGSHAKFYKYNKKLYSLMELSKIISEQFNTPLLSTKYRLYVYFKSNNELNKNSAKNIMDKPFLIRDAKKYYAYSGKKYTISQIAKKTKLSHTAIYNRLKKGCTMAQVFNSTKQYPAQRKCKLYYYKGRKYTLKQLSNKVNIHTNTLYRRLKMGLSIKDSIEKKSNYNVKKYEYKGKKYTRPQIAKKTGLHPATIQYRIESGWNIEDVFKTKTKQLKRKKI